MLTISTKTKARITLGIKKFQTILKTAKSRDINESDTVVIITDMLSEIFGYDKYSEITSEYSIKKTFCDLAIKIDEKIRLLIEVKAIGLDLKDDHIKQAVDYGSNEGVDWVILTNGLIWKIFKIIYSKPIEKELIYTVDIESLNNKSQNDIELIYMLSKEAITKSALDDFRIQQQTLSKFFIGQLLLTEPILNSLRLTLKKVAPDVKINNEHIYKVLLEEVIKRDVLEDDKANEAQKKITKALKPKIQKSKSQEPISEV